jgi:WD40 repeat protein
MHHTSVTAIAFSPDDKTIVTGDADKDVQLWDVETGNRMAPLSGHRGGVNDATFSADGRMVLTGSRDGSARLWSVAGGKPIGPPLSHPRPVVRVAFSQDGETILTVTQDQVTQSWPVPKPMLGTVEQVELWAQVATGMELEDKGGMRILNAMEWRRRRQALQSAGLPMSGAQESSR